MGSSEETLKLEAKGANTENSKLKEMSLLEHLTELRTRLIRAISAVLVIFVISISFANSIINVLKQPLMDALPEGAKLLHFTGPMDVLMVDIKVAFLFSIVVGCPFWLYQFWRFIEPALYPKERYHILPFVVISVALFFAGIAFCFYLILPMMLQFLIGMGLEVGTPIITITDYISLLIFMVFAFGFIFETPLILVLLALLGLFSADTLAKNRKYVMVGILIIGALITPPDVISQLSMALPTYCMFEISILIIRFLKKDK